MARKANKNKAKGCRRLGFHSLSSKKKRLAEGLEINGIPSQGLTRISLASLDLEPIGASLERLPANPSIADAHPQARERPRKAEALRQSAKNEAPKIGRQRWAP